MIEVSAVVISKNPATGRWEAQIFGIPNNMYVGLGNKVTEALADLVNKLGN